MSRRILTSLLLLCAFLTWPLHVVGQSVKPRTTHEKTKSKELSEEEKARIVWLSIKTVPDLPKMQARINDLSERLRKLKVHLVIGQPRAFNSGRCTDRFNGRDLPQSCQPVRGETSERLPRSLELIDLGDEA